MVDIIGHLQRWIVPAACRLCGAPAEPGEVCASCRASLPWNRISCPRCALPLRSSHAHPCGNCGSEPPQQDAALAPFRYETPIAQAIAGLKYHARFGEARWLGAAIAEAAAQRDDPLPDLLIPVPLHASRLRERGYNQALELARGIRRVLPIAIDWRSAQRTRPTADQIGQKAVDRRREVRGAFAVGPAVRGRHIALIDDVMTTGSTVDALARAARATGAARIEVWVAARVA
jgi:ComF family protein